MNANAHVCPWWVGYFLSCPARRLFTKPEVLLAPYVREDMTVLDVGCAMGFFALPMAELVGPMGKVVAIDLQERMIRSLDKRARRRGLNDRIDYRVCGQSDLNIDDLVEVADFALASAVMHEVPDPKKLMIQVHKALAPGGRLWVVEPRGHVSYEAFEFIHDAALSAGFINADAPEIKKCHSIMLTKQSH